MAKSQPKHPASHRWPTKSPSVGAKAPSDKPPWDMDDQAESNVRLCEADGCIAAGDYPAPRSRENLRDYHWFCLEHVKAYNAKWDFLKGMNSAQIEQFIRDSVVGDRPTQPIAGLGKGYENLLRARVLRDFGGFTMEQSDPDAAAIMSGFTADEIKACRALGLPPTRDFKVIKARYRELAKQFHPDANPEANAAAEEKLKVINQAYGALKAAAHS